MNQKIEKSKIDTSEKFAYIFGAVGNIAVIPQLIKAWQSPAPGLAISTWVLLTSVSAVWLWYGIKHNARPLVVAQIIGITLDVLVVAGWVFNNVIR